MSSKKILGLITARGGSKGIPKKNLKVIAGKSLLEWTYLAAKNSKNLTQTILSTEDKDILEEAKKIGCPTPFIRPLDLALDDTTAAATVLHALDQMPGFDHVLLLQPTSPLRTTEDIDGLIDFCFKNNSKSCVSVTEVTKSPALMFSLDSKSKMTPLIQGEITQRQNFPKYHMLNGALYLAEVNWFKKNRSFIDSETVAYPMPQERSIDIDSELDLKIADTLLKGF